MVLRRNIYRGVYHQRGNGIGSVLSGLFRLLTPFIKRGATAALKSAPVRKALKSVKKSALKTATTAASDIFAGKSPKANAKINLRQAQLNIEKAVTKSLAKKNITSNKNPPMKKAKKRKILASKISGPPVAKKKSSPLI